MCGKRIASETQKISRTRPHAEGCQASGFTLDPFPHLYLRLNMRISSLKLRSGVYAREAFGITRGEKLMRVRLLFEPKLAVYIMERECWKVTVNFCSLSFIQVTLELWKFSDA